MAYLGLLVLKVAAQPLECLVSLDEGPYRLEGRGGKEWIYIAAGLKRSKMVRRIRGCASVMNALVFARNIVAATITNLVMS
jgi:hypothetical protein